MNLFQITLYLWVAILLFGTLIPLIREQTYWLRAWTYARLQMLSLIAITSLAVFFWRGFEAGSEKIILVTLIFCATICLLDIYPFTRLSRRDVQSFKRGQSHKSISILVANVLMENDNYSALIDKARVYEPDILFLVETNQKWAEGLSSLSDLYPHTYLLPLEDFNGMLFYSKFPISDVQERYLVQNHIPSLTLELDIGESEALRFYGVHPRPPRPEDSTSDLDKELLFVANEVGHLVGPVFVTGDLNDVGWSSTTKHFLRLSGLKDPRRGRGLYNSYNAKNPFVRWPLDHIFVSRHFAIKNIKRLEASGSDHFPILAEFALLK